ncbi:MAG: efflux RND transporter periplasmic adaptor subunit [Gammaproteobacteria bacterium]|nr:efflux RND transporter periplasmic adaptor subunit [Gammaproteobacteria bacterium]
MIKDTAAQDRPVSAPSRKIPRRRLVLAAAGVALATLSAYAATGWLSGELSVDATRLRIATVERGTLLRDIAVDGRVTAASSPTLYAVAAGTVNLRVVAGDEVAKGQALAELDSPELQSRLAQEEATLASLEAEIERADVSVRQGRAAARNRIEQAEVDRATAAREAERLARAYELGAVPEIDLLRARASLDKAELALEHAHQDAQLEEEGLALDLRTAQQSLDRQLAIVGELRRQVEALTIRSPVDGQVGQVLVAQSAYVATNTPVLSVVDLTAFEVEIKVPESFARDLAIGMPAEIRAANRQYAGRVRSISPEVVNGEVTGRLQFVGDSPAGLRQNQRLSARIVLDEKPNALLVERGPSLESGTGRYAWFVENGVADRRPLEIGAASLDKVEIVSGAEVGARIIVSGADTLGDAERVRLAGD